MRWGWAKKDGSTGSQWIQGTPLAPAPLVLPVKPPSQCLHVRLRSVCRSLVALPHGETCPTIHQLGEVTPSHAPTDAFSASTEFSMPHPPTPSHEFHGELRGEIEWVEGGRIFAHPHLLLQSQPRVSLVETVHHPRRSDRMCSDAGTGAEHDSRFPRPRILVSVTFFHSWPPKPNSVQPRPGRRLA